jgi:SSS family solute:Na+ symporter
MISLVLGIYLLICLALAYYGWKKHSEDLEDFFVTKREAGKVIAFMTFSATLFSSFTLVGLPGYFYTHGIGAFVFVAFADVFMAICIYVFGVKIWALGKKFKYITPTELLKDRYDSNAAMLIAGLIGIVFLLPYISTQLIGAGKALNGAAGIPVIWGSFLLALVLVVYSELGGMRTIAWTDALQGTVLLVVSFLIAGLLILHFGGISPMMQSAAETNPGILSTPGPTGLFTYPMMISFFIMIVFMPVTQPQLTVRYFIPDSKKTLKWMMIATPIFAFLIVLPQIIIGIGANVLFPGLESGDMALTSVLTLVPPVVGALAVTGVIAASMSTADSQLLVLSSTFTKDFYVRFFGKKRRKMLIARLSMLFLLFLAFLMSINPPKLIIDLSILSFAGTLQVLPTMIGALFWKHSTRAGAVLSMLSGVATLSYFQWFFPPPLPLGLHAGILGLIVGTTIFIAASLLTKPPETKRAEEIMGLLRLRE